MIELFKIVKQNVHPTHYRLKKIQGIKETNWIASETGGEGTKKASSKRVGET